MTSKSNVERRLESLEGETGVDGDEGERVTIRSVRVDEDGEPTEVFNRLEIWEDEHGEQHTERTTYDEGEGPDVVEAIREEKDGG